MRFRFVLTAIGILFACSSWLPSQKKPLDEEWFQTASMVEEYQTGYLISILPKKLSMTEEEIFFSIPGWKEYSDSFVRDHSLDTNNCCFRPLKKSDYPLVEKRYVFSLNDKVLFFGRGNSGNVIVRGEGYYLKFNTVGMRPSVEDVMVFVPGSPELKKISPVWAKKYFPGDEFYFEINDPAERLISGQRELLEWEQIHRVISREMDLAAQKEGISEPLWSISTEIKEEVYSVHFPSQGNPLYLIIINGDSRFRETKYCLSYILSGDLKSRFPIIQPHLTSAKYWPPNEFSILHIYHTRDAGEDLIIGRRMLGYGATYYLIFQKNETIVMIPLRKIGGD